VILSSLLITPLLVLLAGSMVYCVLAVIGAARYRASGAPRLKLFPPVSLLRPLSGAADNTEANLRSIFEQQYPEFEVLLSVHELSDPAVAIAQKVMGEYVHVPSRLIVAGVSPFPNAKVWSLRALIPEARHETVVMSDSDIRLAPKSFQKIVSELEQPEVGLVTCPYRATAGPRFWARLEALGLNTEFIGGMLTARLLNGMDFAIGCTIATRKADLAKIGGLEHLQRYLAEDFMMGNLIHKAGRKVILSRCIIEHYIGNDGMSKNWRHRVRWARSTRRSRRWGYVGELFTKTSAIAIMLWILAPSAWGLALIGLAFRWGAEWATGVWVLNDPLVEKQGWLLPFEGIASFVTWVLGFFGNTIDWRGRRLVLEKDGSFSEVATAQPDSPPDR
jgi:ceramide glucosyltransferase